MKKFSVLLITSIICAQVYAIPPLIIRPTLKIECKKAKEEKRARGLKQKKQNAWPPSPLTPPSN